MYRELMEYWEGIADSHVVLTETVKSDALAHANAYNTLKGSILVLDPINGKFTGPPGGTVDAHIQMTIGIQTQFSGDDRLLTEGYHAALETSYEIARDILAKLEYDEAEDADCTARLMDMNSVRFFEGEVGQRNWAEVGLVFMLKDTDVITYNASKWA